MKAGEMIKVDSEPWGTGQRNLYLIWRSHLLSYFLLSMHSFFILEKQNRSKICWDLPLILIIEVFKKTFLVDIIVQIDGVECDNHT
jgi:hypothetical protein